MVKRFRRTGLEDRLLLLVLNLCFVIIIKLRAGILDQNGVHHGNGGDIAQNLIVVRIRLLLLLWTRQLIRLLF